MPLTDSVSNLAEYNHNHNHNCAICMDSINGSKQVYTLPECSHKFHTDCILPWFRSQKRCPLCNNVGNNFVVEEGTNSHRSRWHKEGIMKSVRNLCRRKNAPIALKKIVGRYDEINKKIAQLKKEKRDLHKETGNYADIRRKIGKIHSKIWNETTKKRKILGEISSFKVTEIIVRKIR